MTGHFVEHGPTPVLSVPRPTPSQVRAIEQVKACLGGPHLIVVRGGPGTGKSTVLNHVHAASGGAMLSVGDGMAAIAAGDPDRMEESMMALLRDRYRTTDILFFDDMAEFLEIGQKAAQRPFYLIELIENLYADVLASGKTLVISADVLPGSVAAQAVVISIDDFGPVDYIAMIGGLTAQNMADFDIDALYRGFRKLNAHHLSRATDLLRAQGKLSPSAEDYVAALELLGPSSNVNLDEVDQVSLEGLVGVEDIVQQLKRSILVPMTEPDLARSLGLSPRRGVLLYGPPGTGKTTIGRALAHAMKGRFFMIDGGLVPGTRDFNDSIDSIFTAAEVSSPSVIFIDDADVIFRNGQQTGFARKLLTKLDGLESETRSNVCIVMTAMDVADLPSALVRSGRVEVWLEMKLPDARARAEIIRAYSSTLPVELGVFDEDRIVAASEGFTPADLRGLVGDARGHMAFDRHKARQTKSFDDYLELSAGKIADRRKRLAEAFPEVGAKRR